MKPCKKALSVLLAICLVLTLLPVNAWAAENDDIDGDVPIPEEIVNAPEAGADLPDVPGESVDTNTNPPTPGEIGGTGSERPSEKEPSDVLSDAGINLAGDSLPPDVSAMCGYDLVWTLENGILLISGTGPMFDYAWHVDADLREYLDAPWYPQREEITQIIVGDGVTTIGENAFAACYNVNNVSIADSVAYIGEGAFDGCDVQESPTLFESNAGLLPLSTASGNIRYSVVVLDVSGSMTSEPMSAQKVAAIKFCESLLSAEGSNHIAVVSFGSSVKVVSQFTENIETLKSAIKNIRASGSTNTVGALTKADELLSAIPDTAGRSIVLCSDGLPNTGGSSTNGPFNSSDSSYYYRYANAVYNKAIDLMQKYDIFSLGFFHSLSGNDLEFARKFMPAIQDAGYYEVTDPENLEFTFGDIAGDIVTPGHSGIIIVNVPKDKYMIHVVNEKGKNLKGATVACNGTAGQTIAIFKKVAKN